VENASRWKTAKECRHVEKVEMYEKALEIIIIRK
jgi:hypothetical protein